MNLAVLLSMSCIASGYEIPNEQQGFYVEKDGTRSWISFFRLASYLVLDEKHMIGWMPDICSLVCFENGIVSWISLYMEEPEISCCDQFVVLSSGNQVNCVVRGKLIWNRDGESVCVKNGRCLIKNQNKLILSDLASGSQLVNFRGDFFDVGVFGQKLLFKDVQGVRFALDLDKVLKGKLGKKTRAGYMPDPKKHKTVSGFHS